jgi:F-box and WD-40 domain protein 1/11
VVSESFAASTVQQGSVEAQHSFFENDDADQQQIRHNVHPSHSTPNLNFYAQTPPFLSIPAETASVSSLRASRSRQGSVSTNLTINDANLSTANLSMTDGYLGIPNSSANDVSSLYGLPGLVRQQSVTSSVSVTSSYYTQQYQMHPHMQHQLLPKRSFLSDSESIFFSSKESSTSASKSDQKTDLVRYFPREIIDQIFIILDIKSLNACALVNKNWQSVANANAVWRAKYFQQPYWNTISGYLPEETKELGHKSKKLPPLTWKYVYQTRAMLEERWRNGNVEPKALKGHTDSVYCVHFNENIIVTGSRDQTIKIWDAKSGALIRTLGGINHGQEQHTDNDEEDENIDIEHHETVIVDNQLLFDSTTAFSTPSTAMSEITSNSSSSPDASDNSDLIRHKKSVLCLYFDNELMVSGSSDSSIILWKLPEFVAFKKIQEHDGGILDVTLDKRYICSCSRDSSICVWYRPKAASDNVRFDETTKVELKVRLRGHQSPVNSIHLRGDNIFSAGGDGIVRMWSIEEGVCMREFSGHKRGLACIQVSLDGKTLVSGSNDKQIRVWEIDTGKCVRILEGHTALVRSLDICSGKIISGSYDQTLKLWDLDTGALIHDMDKYFGSWIFSAKANCKRIVCTSFGIKPVILDFGTGLDERCLDFISA